MTGPRLGRWEIQFVPVLLGHGRRLFEDFGAEHIELELVRALEAPGVTHLHHRVRAGRQGDWATPSELAPRNFGEPSS